MVGKTHDGIRLGRSPHLARRYRLQARRLGLAAATCGGYLLVAAMMTVASRGRVVNIFKACASGGTDWRFIAGGPARMIVDGSSYRSWPGFIRRPRTVWRSHVLGLFLPKHLRNLPVVFLIATLAITALIFGSPGTTENHLLDVQVASVILLTTCAAKAASPG